MQGNGIQMFYRSRDIIFSLVLLSTFAIPMLLISLYLFCIFRNYLFFKDNRVGHHQKIITIYKFRTMRINREESNPNFTEISDKRVIFLGHFLRRHRLDELPQLFNVIAGTLSLVGPRPERPEFSLQFAGQIENYNERYAVNPGLTGWAQVNLGYVSNLEETKKKLALDLFYVKNKSFFLDLRILIMTIVITITGFGGR
jgi:lipopolysaccharide/colanic/teichoic acid biosynthesis glycosyltransferase